VTLYQTLHGNALRAANDLWFTEKRGPRAEYEARRDRDREFRRMFSPGGSLAELAHLPSSAGVDALT
jgi:hypothetical protein